MCKCETEYVQVSGWLATICSTSGNRTPPWSQSCTQHTHLHSFSCREVVVALRTLIARNASVTLQPKQTHSLHTQCTRTYYHSTGVSGYEYAYTPSTLFIYTYQVFPQQILSYSTFLYPLLLKHWGRMVYLASFTSLHLRLIALLPLEPSPSKTRTKQNGT